MIYFILTLFFASLISILFMISRKLVAIKNHQIEVPEGALFEIPYIEEVKDITIESIKKTEHMVLVFIVKSYIQFSAFLERKYGEFAMQLRQAHRKTLESNIAAEKAEVSKFLKLISIYKQKINEITHHIKEEERSL